MAARILLLEKQVKILLDKNEKQAAALKESNKLMEDILNMQKNDQVNPDFLSSTLINPSINKNMNPVSNIHNRQENSLDNDIIRIENDQNRLENSATNGNEFLMLNSSLNKLQRTIDKNIEKVEINRDYKLSKATSYNLWLDFLKTELR